MAKVTCDVGEWTEVVTTTGDTLIEARTRSIYLTTDETPPTDPADAYLLQAGQAVVISTGKTVSAWPAQSAHAADVRYMVI